MVKENRLREIAKHFGIEAAGTNTWQFLICFQIGARIRKFIKKEVPTGRSSISFSPANLAVRLALDIGKLLQS